MSKWVLITGASDGIGKQTAIELAKLNFHLILHGRNEEKLLSTKNEIKNKFEDANIDLYSCDLSSLNNIKKFADNISQKFSLRVGFLRQAQDR